MSEPVHFYTTIVFLTTILSMNTAAPTRLLAGDATAPSKFLQIQDTLQLRCYDNQKEIECPAPGKSFYGQDGNFSINAPNYELRSADGIEIIVDHGTGLNWLRKPTAELLTWSEAIDYTDSLEAADFSDWRLPSKRELQGILSYGIAVSPLAKPQPGDDKTIPFTTNSMCVWTLTNRNFPSQDAKAICLDDNHATLSNKYEQKHVYAVRGASRASGMNNRLQQNENSTTLDLTTGLMWQKDESRPANWEEALAYCEKLELAGFNDWRLPTIKELSSLVDENRITPAIDTAYFPAARSAPYWAGTTFTDHPGFAWYVHFDNGLEYNGGYKGRRYFVRAVRGGTVQKVTPALPSFLQPADKQELESAEREPERLKHPSKKPNQDFLEPYPLDPNANYE